MAFGYGSAASQVGWRRWYAVDLRLGWVDKGMDHQEPIDQDTQSGGSERLLTPSHRCSPQDSLSTRWQECALFRVWYV